MSELLPCPFCGGEPIVEPVDDTAFVGCQTCQIYFHEFKTEAAIERWNTRAQPIAPDVAELVDAAKALHDAIPDLDWNFVTSDNGLTGSRIEAAQKRLFKAVCGVAPAPGVGEAGRTDTERLDWLSERITAQATIGGWKFQKGIGDAPQFINNLNGGLRAAIDAAMNESEAK